MVRSAVSLLVLFHVLVGALPVRAEDPLAEHRIKAAILYKLTKFIEWPNLHAEADSFRICIIGDAETQEGFSDLEGKSIKGTPISLHNGNAEHEHKLCSLLYLGSAHEFSQNPGSQGALTVSDVKGFCEAGGMIELYRKRNKMRFRINPGSANEQGIRLSSQLLKIADIVAPGK